jgi:hypothetical protein
VRRALAEVLPPRRKAWAERLLQLALWLQAGGSQAMPTGRWRDGVVLAHELLAGHPLTDLPAMVALAKRTSSRRGAGTW